MPGNSPRNTSVVHLLMFEMCVAGRNANGVDCTGCTHPGVISPHEPSGSSALVGGHRVCPVKVTNSSPTQPGLTGRQLGILTHEFFDYVDVAKNSSSYSYRSGQSNVQKRLANTRVIWQWVARFCIVLRNEIRG